jgi:transcriptional regulator with XRE-family HTH domain
MESLAAVFGKRLRLLRKAHGLTQEQLGERANIDYKHIGAIERGVKTPSFEAIERLAKTLKVSYYEMFLSDQRLQKEDAEFEVLLKDIEKHGTPALKQFILQILAGAKGYQDKSRE